MALTPQAINVNFAKGLDTKTDPFQVQLGKFESLQNSIFDKAGRLTKRNGFGHLTQLSDDTSKFLTTFNGNLTAIGNSVQAFSTSSNTWLNKGSLQPINLSTLPVIRSSTNQSQSDTVVASNGAACTVYTDLIPSAGSNVAHYKYVVFDSVTGQNLIAPVSISTADTTYGTPRVFLLDNYFIVLYTQNVAGTYHLKYIAISVNMPTTVTAAVDVASSYIPATTLAFDGLVVNSRLYVAYNTTAGGQAVKVTFISASLGNPATAVTFASEIATLFSLAADLTTPQNPIIYVSYYNLPTTTGKILAVNANLHTVLAATQFISSGTVLNLTSTAINGVASVFYEVSNAYSYDSGIQTNLVKTNTITQAGSVGSASTLVRSVGLASKAFLLNSVSYFLGVYSSSFQPTYFLLNSSGKVIAKLAYSNSGPYLTKGLPGVSLNGSTAYISYLFKDLIQAMNRTQGSANPTGVYAQLGVNLASFSFDVSNVATSEIGSNLNLTGGFLSMYDGYTAVENNFFLWPDSVEATWSATGGSIHAQPDSATNTNAYYYQVTYEWADNQGNIFRSAPSIPVGVTTTSNGTTGSITVNVPTLRLTYKISNPVKIVIYRWSVGQQNYYQVTSITIPTLNDPTTDSIAFVDTLADPSILGNNLIYTTGGVIENIAAPATNLMTLFNNRLWIVDAEDTNLLWYSKQVIEATPVEMSDLLTLYIAPTTGSEGSTGPITAIAPMDDKLIIFKNNALGYINGIGPDNTGANSQYSDFTLINSVVGCIIPQSIVFMPQGLMFQSSKGIWLLGRDLSTSYIGAPVETFTTDSTVLSALNIPATNQVRFTLDSGITLMYDYYFGEWSTFTKVPAISSVVYQNLHTYLNDSGQVFQETPGSYLDNTSPVLMSFTTGWVNLAGLQGLQRFYDLYLLGQYITPFKLSVAMQFNYNPSSQQVTMVTPQSPTPNWGGEQLWGSGSVWGGEANVFESRISPQIQKCESFQLSITEIYDSSSGLAAGAGLTLSGMNLMVGMLKGSRLSPAKKSFG